MSAPALAPYPIQRVEDVIRQLEEESEGSDDGKANATRRKQIVTLRGVLKEELKLLAPADDAESKKMLEQCADALLAALNLQGNLSLVLRYRQRFASTTEHLEATRSAKLLCDQGMLSAKKSCSPERVTLLARLSATLSGFEDIWTRVRNLKS